MFVLGVVEISMKYFHANSVFEPPTADHQNCPNYWWRNLLYINTWFPVEQMVRLSFYTFYTLTLQRIPTLIEENFQLSVKQDFNSEFEFQNISFYIIF